jgi:hypothetical protein
MNLLQSYQYQGIESYNWLVIHGYNYWSNDRRKAYTFNNASEWSKLIAPTTAAKIVQASNAGSRLFTGITDSFVTAGSIAKYNPLTVQARTTSIPLILKSVDEGGAKLINYDFTNERKMIVKAYTTGAANTLTIRLYTSATAYYNVLLTMPIANTEYTFTFDPFTNGNYGVVGTPVVVGSNTFNSGVAAVTQVSTPSGTLITDFQFFASAVAAGSQVSLVSAEMNNNLFQNLGQNFAVKVCCFQEFTKELERTYNELKCGTKVTGKSLTEQKMTVTLKTKKSIEMLNALGLANDIYEKNITTLGVKQTVSPTITTGNVTASVANAANIVLVSIDDGSSCFNLHRDYVNSTTDTLDPNMFYVDVASNKIVLPNSVATYSTVDVYNWTTQLARVVDYYTKNNPIKVVLQVERASTSGVQTTGDMFTVELGYPKSSTADDGDEWEFECNVLLTAYDQAFTYTY